MTAEDRTAEITAFSAAAQWTGVTDQDFGAWMLARKQIVTASRVSALLGLSPFEDELDVYVDMVMPVQAPENDVELGLQDPRTWGRALERAVAETAAKHYRWQLRMSGCLLVSRKHPHLGATLDAEVCESREWVPYEGKTTAAWRARDWDEETGGAPDHVLVQAQTQLLITGAPREYLCCLIGGNRFSRIELYRSPELQALIVEVTEQFMERVRMLDPPPPTYRSREALARLYPEDDGAMVALPRESIEWTRELQDIVTTRKELKMRADELKNHLRQAIGSATYGVLPEEVGGKGRWKNTVEHRQGHTSAPSSARVLRAVKAFGTRGRRALTAPVLVNETQIAGELAGPIRFRGRRRAGR